MFTLSEQVVFRKIDRTRLDVCYRIREIIKLRAGIAN